MSWFTEQIRRRAENDRRALEDAYFSLGSVIMDKWSAERLEDERQSAGEAIDDVLRACHVKPVAIPENIRDAGEQINYALRRTGLMAREVELEEGWQNRACGPMLGYLKETGTVVSLRPGRLFGYRYRDPATGRTVRITRKNSGQFSRTAMCFYQPLPMKKLGIRDLLLYMKNCITQGDLAAIALITLAVQLVDMLEPRIYSLVTGRIMHSGNMNLMIGLGVFLLTSAFAAQLIGLARNMLMQRISTKTSMAVEASVMMRILSLPVSFFRGYSSGELASRAQSVNSLCGMMLKSILSVGLSSLMSLLYVAQIFTFAPSLVWPAILIILATVGVSLAVSLLQIGISRRRMKLAAEESGMVYAVMNGIQKIRLSGSEKTGSSPAGRACMPAAHGWTTIRPPS